MADYHAAERANAALSKIRGVQLTTTQVLELAIAQSSLAVAEAARFSAEAQDRHTAALTEAIPLLRTLAAMVTDKQVPLEAEEGALEDKAAQQIAAFEAQIEDARNNIDALMRGEG